jgi:hypothetical protein
MGKELSKNAKLVINYMKKHNCNIIMKWSYGVQIHRILKNNSEKRYPRINEETYCEIRKYINPDSDDYQNGLTYSLIDTKQ